MEAKLQSYKVPELKELLQSAKLPTTGNKPDLIKRLLENPDALKSLKNEASPQAEAEAETPKVGDITADQKKEQEVKAKTEPAETNTVDKKTLTATGIAGESNPVSSAPSDTERKNALLAELEKRKARAIRFGQSHEDLDKQILRIQKFGIDAHDAASVNNIDTELKKRSSFKATTAPAKIGNAPAAPAESFVDPEEMERRKRRAERFGLVPQDEQIEKRKRTT